VNNLRNYRSLVSQLFSPTKDVFKEMRTTSILTAISIGLISLGSIASVKAETYKTDKNAVVITGLSPKSTHNVQTTSVKGKNNTRKPKLANACGELLIVSGAKYPTLLVDAETITTAGLPTKVHPTCKAPKAKKVVANPTTLPTP
jgi:hypothetical protein